MCIKNRIEYKTPEGNIITLRVIQSELHHSILCSRCYFNSNKEGGMVECDNNSEHQCDYNQYFVMEHNNE